MAGGSVEDVYAFLQERNVDTKVLQRFKENKMDAQAVLAATKDDLFQLGLEEKGHILCVKAFVMRTQGMLEETKREDLANAIKKSSSDRTVVKRDLPPHGESKVVQIGWKHSNGPKNLAQVRKQSGGGVREVQFSFKDFLSKVKEQAINLFFPNGNSKKCGSLNNVLTSLGDFSGEIIYDLNQTIGSYLNTIKMSGKPRLYLLTEKRNLFQELLNRNPTFSDDSEDDFDIPEIGFKDFAKIENIERDSTKKARLEEGSLLHPIMIGNSSERNLSHVIPDSQNPQQNVLPSQNQVFQTSERSQLISNQDIEFKQSLDADRLKDRKKLDEEAKFRHLIELMNERKNSLQPEPDLSQPHVTITIRSDVGNKCRLFHEHSSFEEVYNWAGSFSPEYFVIKEYGGCIIFPESKVYSGIFNKVETNEQYFDIKAPGNILESYHDTSFEMMEQLRLTESEKMKEEILLFINRDNIYDDMIQHYRKRKTVTHKIQFSFNGEEAAGDGVNRDAYSAFFEKLYSKMEGDDELIPILNGVDEAELETIGKIINHAFVQHGIFPTRFSKVTFKHFLFNDISDEELFTSFMRIVTRSESESIQKFSKGDLIDPQTMIDILSDYSIFERPSSDNITSLCIKAAKVAFIRNPCFSIQTIARGMGHLWRRTDPHMVEALYSYTEVNAENVINNICPNEICAKDQQVTTWLHRFIRSSNQQTLLSLVRFISGSTNLLPNSSIKLEYVNQNRGNLHPSAQTCFRILILPRQFSSFHELRTNLNTYLNNEDIWTVHDTFNPANDINSY